jgi:hypothetical protein
MDDTSGYFTLIDELVASFPPDPDRVSTVLGVALKRDPDSSGPLEEVWEGASPEGKGPFESVMLRLPGAVSDSRQSTLSLQLAQSRFVTRDGIIERFGADYAFRPPSPRYPPGAVPAYMTYDPPWGKLGFGVAPDPQGELREILLQVELPPAPPAVEAGDEQVP